MCVRILSLLSTNGQTIPQNYKMYYLRRNVGDSYLLWYNPKNAHLFGLPKNFTGTFFSGKKGVKLYDDARAWEKLELFVTDWTFDPDPSSHTTETQSWSHQLTCSGCSTRTTDDISTSSLESSQFQVQSKL